MNAFASAVGVPVGIALSGTSMFFSLSAVITPKSLKIFTVKQEKHDAIKLLAYSKLDKITCTISQAVLGGDTTSIEFHNVLQKVEKYGKLKAEIRNKDKTKVRQIMKRSFKETKILLLYRVSVSFKI